MLLYILDSETNFVIIISCFIGLLIEIWKITKVCKVSLNTENRFLGVFPRITVSDQPSYVESSTKEYDRVSTHLHPATHSYCGVQTEQEHTHHVCPSMCTFICHGLCTVNVSFVHLMHLYQILPCLSARMLPCCAVGLQVPRLGAISALHLLWGVLAAVPGTQRMVLICTRDVLRVSPYIW